MKSAPTPALLRLVGLAVCGDGSADGLDRLAAQAVSAGSAVSDETELRNACRQRLGLNEVQRQGARYLGCDAAGLAEALRHAGETPLSVLEGRCGELAWAVVLAPSAGGDAEVRIGLSAPGAVLMMADDDACRHFVLALWQINDRFRLVCGADGSERRIPWICGDRGGRRMALNVAGATLSLSEASPDAARTRLQRRRSHELIVLAGDSRSDLGARIQTLRAALAGAPRPLVDIAAQCAAGRHGPVRAALVASDHDDLAQKLGLLETALGNLKQTRYAHPRGVWASFETPGGGKLAFVFPGQGAQYFGMFADTARYLDSVRHWFDLLDAHYAVAPRPSDTLYGQPGDAAGERLYALAHGGQACLAAALAQSELLELCGAHPDFMVGHSNGENAAILAAFFLLQRPREDILAGLESLYALFSGADEHNPHVIGRGRNVALTLPDPEIRSRALAVLAGRGFVSIDNCPAQLLVHLMPESADSVLAEMAALGVTALRLPFDQPFHTPLFGEHAERFAQAHAQIDDSPMRAVLYSAATVEPFPADAPGRRVAAAAQWNRTVRFRETTRRLYDDGARIFVDVGASGRLAGFVRDTLRGEPHSALACDAENGSGFAVLLRTLGQLFVMGKADNLAALFAGWLPAGSTPLPAMPAATAPAAPADNSQALYLVQRHFALMREFLDTQTRVMGVVVARLANEQGVSGQERSPAALVKVAASLEADPLSFYSPQLLEEKPGEVRWQVTLDLARHGFLGQHSFGKPLTCRPSGLTGLAVSPMVFSIEMCAAAALRANGGGVVTAVAASRGYQWVTVAQQIRLLRIEARRQAAPGGWAVRLCCDKGEVLFACTVELAPAYPPAPTAGAESREPLRTPTMELASFNALTFHGAGYLAIRSIRRLTSSEISVAAEVPPLNGMITGVADAGALATPAPLLDTFGQLTALFALQSRSNVGLFPVSIERIELYAPPAPPGCAFTVLASCVQSHEAVRANLDFIDARGGLSYRVVSAEQRIFDWGPTFRKIVFSNGRNEPFAAISRPDENLWCAILDDIDATLLTSSNGLWLEVVARSILGAIEREAWSLLATAAPARKISWLLGRIAGKSALLAALRAHHGWDGDYTDIAITNLESGAPHVQLADGGQAPTLSISHCDGCAVALVSTGSAGIGIDVEPLDAFADLAHLAREIVAVDEREALQRAGLVRLWCAKEAASKAAGTGLRGRPDAWVTSAWDYVAAGWTAEVVAPAADGGDRYAVTLSESGSRVVAVAREHGQIAANWHDSGSAQQQNQKSVIGA